MLLFYCFIIYLSLFGARATLLHFPHDISTNLFNSIWFYLFIEMFFSILKKINLILKYIPAWSNFVTLFFKSFIFSNCCIYYLVIVLISSVKVNSLSFCKWSSDQPICFATSRYLSPWRIKSRAWRCFGESSFLGWVLI